MISKHIKKIFRDGELTSGSNVANFTTVQIEGEREIEREIEYYNLDMILSMGYRVNSMRGAQFRIWANRILKEHLVHGYTLNQIRLQEEWQRIRELKESLVCRWEQMDYRSHVSLFLGANGLLYGDHDQKLIGNDGLAALALLIAMSKPEEKDTMIRIIMTILNRRQGN